VENLHILYRPLHGKDEPGVTHAAPRAAGSGPLDLALGVHQQRADSAAQQHHKAANRETGGCCVFFLQFYRSIYLYALCW
jgi:hypothetical protein